MNEILVPEKPKKPKNGKKSFARKKTLEPVRVYCYGALPPKNPEQLEMVNRQIWLARKYRNVLMELEVERRKRYRELRESLVPGYSAADEKASKLREAKEAVIAEMKQYRQTHRTKKASKELIAKKKQCLAELAEANAPLRVFREKAKKNKKLKKASSELNKWARDEGKRLYNSEEWAEVYWGQKQLAGMAVKQCKHSKNDPAFRKWNREGAVGIQLIGGTTVTSILSNNRYFQVDPVPEDTFELPRHRRRMASRTKCRIRVGSEGRKPIWAEFGMIYHRPLPADGRITRMQILRRRIGFRFRWFVLISVESKEFFAPQNRRGRGVAAIDVGWRSGGPGHPVRYAFMVNDDGQRTDLRLPWDIFGRISYTEKLRSIQDHNFNKFKRDFKVALGAMKVAPPEWFAKDLKYFDRWRKREKMYRVIGKWGRERWDGDEGPWAIADAWKRQNSHLYQWERDQHRRSLNRRLDIYRNMAHELANRYSKIVVETLNVAKLRQRDEDNPMPQAAQRLGHYVAVGQFLAMLRQACIKSGCLIEGVDPAYTTTVCHKCGSCEKWDQKQLYHKCSECGERWDQDENAAWNILASAEVTPKTTGPLETRVAPEKRPKKPRKRKAQNPGGVSLKEVLANLELQP